MMATPADLEDFAYGFSLTEGIVDDVREIKSFDRLDTDNGIAIQMLIPHERFNALGNRNRNMTGRTGCGLCGASTLEAAIRPIRRVPVAVPIAAKTLRMGFERLQAAQLLNRASGAMHGAALLTTTGQTIVREDVGRHNAVDKVIGAALAGDLAPHALLVTSRASYEVIHKAAQAGCSIVAAISAPTAMAVRIAAQAGVTLIGFARGDRMTVYEGNALQLPATTQRHYSNISAAELQK
jgi:formate dehydrogenase accessory protein FdhD